MADSIPLLSLYGAQLRFLQSFSTPAPLCDIDGCTGKAANFYKIEQTGKGLMLCLKCESALTKLDIIVNEVSPYPYEKRRTVDFKSKHVSWGK